MIRQAVGVVGLLALAGAVVPGGAGCEVPPRARGARAGDGASAAIGGNSDGDAVPAARPGAERVNLRSLPPNHMYPGARPPLFRDALASLPPGRIEPAGWLRAEALETLAMPLSRRSDAAVFRGIVSLAHLLGETELLAAVREELGRLASQALESTEAPGETRGAWESTLESLLALREQHSATRERRLLEGVLRQLALQLDSFTDGQTGLFDADLAVDNLDLAHWAYDLTGEPWLLRLAEALAGRIPDRTGLFLGKEALPRSLTAVELARALREPAVRHARTGSRESLTALEAGWRAVRRRHGRLDGMFSDPRDEGEAPAAREVNVCATVETLEALRASLRVTGDPVWADRLERLALNALPAAVFVGRNAAVASSASENDLHVELRSIDSIGDRCVATSWRGWPLVVSSLWMAAPGDGLAALGYFPCRVEALVGEDEGSPVRVEVTGEYPFSSEVTIELTPQRPVRFPLALRIPGWCQEARVRINQGAPLGGEPGSFLTLSRKWREGDRVVLELPPRLLLREFALGSRSVERGPIVFSIPVPDTLQPLPSGEPVLGPRSSAWSRALLLDPATPATTLRPTEVRGFGGRAFRVHFGPVTLQTIGRPLPGWTADRVASPPRSPVPERALGPGQEVLWLLPYGATALRITRFPWSLAR